MPITLTSETLIAAYDLLELTEPFCRWNLPPSDSVKFEITPKKDRHGECDVVGPDVYIRISPHYVGRMDSLIITMAHEMIHLYMYHSQITEPNPHGPGYRKLAALVCREHGFDPKLF